MSTLYYPLDMQGTTDYGNSYVIFTSQEYTSKMMSNPGKDVGKSSVPSNAPSGSAVPSSSGGMYPFGPTNPLSNLVKDPHEKFTGSKIGGLVPEVNASKGNIVLYVPEDAAISYNAKWEESNHPIAASAIEALASDGNSSYVEKLWSALKSGAGAAMSDYAKNSLPGADYILSQAGHAVNPKKQLLFKDMEFRQFQFTYNFFIKNKAEASTVLEILRTFKYGMHPYGANDGTFLYNYPNEFLIEYYANNAPNPFMHKFKKSALIGMDVRYTPQGLFVSHEDGSFTTCQMVLKFKELEILTKDDFMDAGNSH